MELKYVDSYVKSKPKVVNGVPVVVDGKVVYDKRTMYLYAVVNATPAEITEYKRFKRDNPDDADYYRESQGGVPYWHSTEFDGLTVGISKYVDKNGKLRFRTNKAMIGALEGLKEKHPSLSGKVDDALWNIYTAGGPTTIEALESSIAKLTNDAADLLVEGENEGTDESKDSEGSPEADL